MSHDRIEPRLLTDQIRKEYRARFTRSMESVASSRAETLELTTRLEGETRRLKNKKTSLADYLASCRRSMDTGQWPAILIKAGNENKFKTAKKELEQLGFTLKNLYPVFNLLQVQIPPVPAILHRMADLAFIDYLFDAERDFTLPVPIAEKQKPKMETPSSLQHLLFSKGVPAALDNAGREVTICILDSGIDMTHPEFENRILCTKNFTNDPDIEDGCGHGTHVAGIALGRHIGIAPHARLLVAKVLNANGSGATEWILNGLRWAYEQGADIINLSLGCANTPADGRSVLAMACDTLAEYGIVVCISAGNDGPEPGTLTSPADARTAVCVAASRGDETAEFSSRGPTADPAYTGEKPDIAAPGVRIISARSSACSHPPVDANHRYTSLSGTSMSCPMVAGLCALFLSHAWQKNLWLDTAHIKEILTHGADRRDEGQGAGIVDGNKGFGYLEEMIRVRKQYQIIDDDEKPFGRYQVGKFIGKGGFAKVYEAWDTALKKTFALKIPTRQQLEQSMENWARYSLQTRLHIRSKERENKKLLDAFLEEAQKQAHMDHPAVVRVKGYETHYGLSGIVMDYMKGGSLLSRLETSGPLLLEDCLPVMEAMASALDFAHTRFRPPGAGPGTPMSESPLLHFDINPKNIVFDIDGSAKLTDFGIARIIPRGPGTARMSRLVCTPEYAGPEQIEGKMDPRSEIWSLGAVFYEILTGKCCFGGEPGVHSETVLSRILKKDFVPVQQINPDLPEPIADLVMTMLRSGKGEDFDSMARVLERIRQVRQALAAPALVPEAQTTERRTRPRVSMALALVMLLILGGVLASPYLFPPGTFKPGIFSWPWLKSEPGPVHVAKTEGTETKETEAGETETGLEIREISEDEARQLMETAWDELNNYQYTTALELYDRAAAGTGNRQIQAQAAYMSGIVLHRTIHDRMPSEQRKDVFHQIIARTRAFLEAHEEDRLATDVRLLLGESLMGVGSPSLAAAEFEHIVTHSPDKPDAVEKARAFLRHINR